MCVCGSGNLTGNNDGQSMMGAWGNEHEFLHLEYIPQTICKHEHQFAQCIGIVKVMHSKSIQEFL